MGTSIKGQWFNSPNSFQSASTHRSSFGGWGGQHPNMGAAWLPRTVSPEEPCGPNLLIHFHAFHRLVHGRLWCTYFKLKENTAIWIPWVWLKPDLVGGALLIHLLTGLYSENRAQGQRWSDYNHPSIYFWFVLQENSTAMEYKKDQTSPAMLSNWNTSRGWGAGLLLPCIMRPHPGRRLIWRRMKTTQRQLWE